MTEEYKETATTNESDSTFESKCASFLKQKELLVKEVDQLKQLPQGLTLIAQQFDMTTKLLDFKVEQFEKIITDLTIAYDDLVQKYTDDILNNETKQVLNVKDQVDSDSTFILDSDGSKEIQDQESNDEDTVIELPYDESNYDANSVDDLLFAPKDSVSKNTQDSDSMFESFDISNVVNSAAEHEVNKRLARTEQTGDSYDGN